MTQTECDALIAEFESDLNTGVHERITVSRADVFATAEALPEPLDTCLPCIEEIEAVLGGIGDEGFNSAT